MALPAKLDAGRKQTGLPCSVQKLLNELPPEDSTTLNAWLYEYGYSQEAIFNELQANGHVVGKQTINRHRSRACRCYQ